MADDSLPLGRAHQLASIVVKETRRAGLAVDTLISVGQLRRYEPAVTSVEVLAVAAASEHPEILSRFARLPIATASREHDDRSVNIITDRGPVTIYLTTPEDAGAALVWYTGSPDHVEALQQRAAWRGLEFRGEARVAERRDDLAPRTPRRRIEPRDLEERVERHAERRDARAAERRAEAVRPARDETRRGDAGDRERGYGCGC